MTSDYYDTGILLKLYTNEPESLAVERFVKQRRRALRVTDLHVTESMNALQLKAFRGECSQEQAHVAIGLIEDDLRSGILRISSMDWPEVWKICQTLTRTHSADYGTRTLDILHIACAILLHTRNFITSDSRQANLAKTCGLRVQNPV